MRIRPAPLRVASSLAILAFDWLVLALNVVTHVHDLAASTLVGASGAALVVALVERRGEPSFAHTLWRALFAAAVVAVPMPVLGTAVAVAGLIWSAVAHAHAQRAA